MDALMEISRTFLMCIALAMTISNGCLHRKAMTVNPVAPAVFFEAPRLEDVIRVVNENSTRVQQLQTTGATLFTHGYNLRADMAFARPNRFRLKAGTMLTGSEFDLGSNDELLWLWVDRIRPPAIYFARHSDMRTGRVRDSIPVSPEFLVEGMGIIWLDPSLPHEGPWRTQPGRIEIRTPVRLSDTDCWRTIVLDDTRGWTLEQRVVDGKGELLVRSITTDHRYDATNGVSLPHRIHIAIPAAHIDFELRVDQYVVNQLLAESQTLFEMPHPTGAAVLDLANPNVRNPFHIPSQTRQTQPIKERRGESSRLSGRHWLKRYNGFDTLH